MDSILAMGKFSIKAWNSNHTDVEKTPEENEVDFLGHMWNKRKDIFMEKPKQLPPWDRSFEKERLRINEEIWGSSWLPSAYHDEISNGSTSDLASRIQMG